MKLMAIHQLSFKLMIITIWSKAMEKPKSTNKKKKKFSIDIKNMGIDIDKNEYRTIVQTHTNYPERYFR